MPPTVLIAGGGTGGHLFPGIAVARELTAKGARVSFVGTATGLEARVLPREGFDLDVIRSAGLKGKSPAALLRGVGLLPLSAADAWHVLSSRRPDVVVGVGGYSSGPVVLLAAMRGTPTLLMEQNATPGLTNRLLAPVVKAAAVTYEESARFFGPKAFVSGNPVRREFFSREPRARRDPDEPVRVLVFGGSQGAHAINVAMVEGAAGLAGATPRLAITHQTGERDLEMVREGYVRAGLEARVEPFLFAMDHEMASADFAVCRSGATTLAELTAAGLPAILVPLPTATDNHQHRNAVVLARQLAAEIVDQGNLAMLASRIAALARDPERRAHMAEAARRFARPDAAAVIAAHVLELAGA